MLFRWFEHSRVYHPKRELIATGAELGRPFENLFFKTSDGVELNGWFFPGTPASGPASDEPRRAGSETGVPVFLICHGNGGNISHRLDLYRALLETGTAVFAFDYRGYGRSQGKPGEEGTYLDAQGAHRWLRQKGFAGKNIIAYGESLGGGIASELCLREETGGLILQSTFTSIPALGAELYPWLPVRLIGSIQYDVKSKLPRLKIPVLVMHSREDGLIGFRHSEQNFAAANEPKFFCELQGAHCDAPWEAPGFREAIEKFLAAM
jgi:pimeloyl-ACP methyl ester carboxylesterase